MAKRQGSPATAAPRDCRKAPRNGPPVQGQRAHAAMMKPKRKPKVPARPMRASDVDCATELLSGLAPELGLRLVHRIGQDHPGAVLSASLCRALFSILLRANTVSDATAAHDALRVALSLPNEFDFGVLGFAYNDPNTMSEVGTNGHERMECVWNKVMFPSEPNPSNEDVKANADKSQFPAVLYDLVQAVAQQTALTPTGAALRFYDTAGVGSADDADYDALDEESLPSARCKLRNYRSSLKAVRVRNAALALECFAQRFSALGRLKRKQRPKAASPLISQMSLDAQADFWNVLTKVVPKNVLNYDDMCLKALQSMHVAALDCEPILSSRRHVKDIAHALHELSRSHKNTSAARIYASSFPSAPYRMQASIAALDLVRKRKSENSTTGRASSSCLAVDEYINLYVYETVHEGMQSSDVNLVTALLGVLGTALFDVETPPQRPIGPATRKKGDLDRLHAALFYLEIQEPVQVDLAFLRIAFASIASHLSPPDVCVLSD